MNGLPEPRASIAFGGSADDEIMDGGSPGGAAPLALPEPVMPFGPYRGLSLADLARLDPGHLLVLVREGIGDAELRAAAAQALARGTSDGQRLLTGGRPGMPPLPLAQPAWGRGPGGGGGLQLDGAGARPWMGGLRSLAPWLLGAGIGLALLRLGDGWPTVEAPSPVAEAPDSAASAASAASADPIPTLVTVNQAAIILPTEPVVVTPDAATAVLAPPALSAATADPPTAGAYDPAAPCGRRATGAVAADRAGEHLDQFAAVEFAVTGTKDTGKVTFLNSHEPYQGHFYVAIFPDLYSAFPAPPASFLAGRCVVVQGRVEAFRGVPQIVLRDAADLRDLGAARPEPAAATTPRLPAATAAP